MLGALNAAAVSSHHRAPHDRAAHAAAGGAGGLYRQRWGALALADARYALWLGKPNGVGDAEFEALVRMRSGEAPCGLWQRQLVLGPAREYCLLSPEETHLPGYGGTRAILHRVGAAGD